MSEYYVLTAFDWQPFDELVSDSASSAHAKLAEGLISTGMVKTTVLADCPEYQAVLRDSLPQLLVADEWYNGASQEDVTSRGTVLDAIFNRKDPLWCYPTTGEFAVLWDIVQLIVGRVEIVATDEGWSHRFIAGDAPRTRELQWLGNRPFRCGGWDGAEPAQRDFLARYKRMPYSIHSPAQVALLKADIADAAEACRRLPFEELRDEYESLAGQIGKAVELGQALYVKRADPKDVRTSPDYMIERMLEDVGIHIGPPKKKFYAHSYFNELQCGDYKELTYRAKCLEEDFQTMGEDCESLGPQGNPAYCYRLCIDKCLWMLYDWHFGFRGATPPQDVVAKGVDMALKYFRLIADRLVTATANAEWMEDAAWFEPYSEALLLSTLGGYIRERTLLSDYVHLGLGLATEKTTLSRNEAGLRDVLLCIAASFQSSPMDIAPLLKRLRKSRNSRLKPLLQAWEAIQSGHQAKFTGALTECIASFAKTAADNRPRAAIALMESILTCLAYERGWRNLDFELPIEARLVTRRSIDMD